MGLRWILWNLVRPPDDGGMGMAPSEAKRLSVSEAIFYLASREKIEKSCKHMNRQIDDVGKTPADLRAEAEDYKRALRLKFTGSEEL